MVPVSITTTIPIKIAAIFASFLKLMPAPLCLTAMFTVPFDLFLKVLFGLANGFFAIFALICL